MNTQIIQFKDLSEFLAKHNAKNDKSLPITHTRIGDKEANIFAGAYSIPKESLQVFHSLYYDNVFVKKRKDMKENLIIVYGKKEI